MMKYFVSVRHHARGRSKLAGALNYGFVVVAVLAGFVAGSTVANMAFDRAVAGTCNLEQWTGSPGNDSRLDTTDGVDERNDWAAQAGGDFLRALACDDFPVDGKDGQDDVGGGSGLDEVDGDNHGDFVYGGAGGTASINDIVRGLDGHDNLFDTELNDHDDVRGGIGDDTVDVNDSDGHDLVVGGNGTDSCDTDPADVEDCEN